MPDPNAASPVLPPSSDPTPQNTEPKDAFAAADVPPKLDSVPADAQSDGAVPSSLDAGSVQAGASSPVVAAQQQVQTPAVADGTVDPSTQATTPAAPQDPGLDEN